MSLVEATNVLAAAPIDTLKSMLNIYVLRENSTFKMEDFLTGTIPPKTEVALSQSLVSI
jgi:hypothetical protein